VPSDKTRVEYDLLGNKEVLGDAYYGEHTLRAVEHFPVTGTPISHYPELIRALAEIKLAAARANEELGLLPRDMANAIGGVPRECRQACRPVRRGRHAWKLIQRLADPDAHQKSKKAALPEENSGG
jgi:aspartate ammonia-lyase